MRCQASCRVKFGTCVVFFFFFFLEDATGMSVALRVVT